VTGKMIQGNEDAEQSFPKSSLQKHPNKQERQKRLIQTETHNHKNKKVEPIHTSDISFLGNSLTAHTAVVSAKPTHPTGSFSSLGRILLFLCFLHKTQRSHTCSTHDSSSGFLVIGCCAAWRTDGAHVIRKPGFRVYTVAG
jgi:hypothetical protein